MAGPGESESSPQQQPQSQDQTQRVPPDNLTGGNFAIHNNPAGTGWEEDISSATARPHAEEDNNAGGTRQFWPTQKRTPDTKPSKGSPSHRGRERTRPTVDREGTYENRGPQRYYVDSPEDEAAGFGRRGALPRPTVNPPTVVGFERAHERDRGSGSNRRSYTRNPKADSGQPSHFVPQGRRAPGQPPYGSRLVVNPRRPPFDTFGPMGSMGRPPPQPPGLASQETSQVPYDPTYQSRYMYPLPTPLLRAQEEAQANREELDRIKQERLEEKRLADVENFRKLFAELLARHNQQQRPELEESVRRQVEMKAQELLGKQMLVETQLREIQRTKEEASSDARRRVETEEKAAADREKRLEALMARTRHEINAAQDERIERSNRDMKAAAEALSRTRTEFKKEIEEQRRLIEIQMDGFQARAKELLKIEQLARESTQQAKDAVEAAKLSASAVQNAASKAMRELEHIHKAAGTAEATASQAEGVAQESKRAADEAKRAMDGVERTVEDAKRAADEAKTVMDGVERTAEDAKRAADEAKAVMDGVGRTAEDAKRSAKEARDMAEASRDSRARAGNGGVVGASEIPRSTASPSFQYPPPPLPPKMAAAPRPMPYTAPYPPPPPGWPNAYPPPGGTPFMRVTPRMPPPSARAPPPPGRPNGKGRPRIIVHDFDAGADSDSSSDTTPHEVDDSEKDEGPERLFEIEVKQALYDAIFDAISDTRPWFQNMNMGMGAGMGAAMAPTLWQIPQIPAFRGSERRARKHRPRSPSSSGYDSDNTDAGSPRPPARTRRRRRSSRRRHTVPQTSSKTESSCSSCSPSRRSDGAGRRTRQGRREHVRVREGRGPNSKGLSSHVATKVAADDDEMPVNARPRRKNRNAKKAAACNLDEEGARDDGLGIPPEVNAGSDNPNPQAEGDPSDDSFHSVLSDYEDLADPGEGTSDPVLPDQNAEDEVVVVVEVTPPPSARQPKPHRSTTLDDHGRHGRRRWSSRDTSSSESCSYTSSSAPSAPPIVIDFAPFGAAAGINLGPGTIPLLFGALGVPPPDPPPHRISGGRTRSRRGERQTAGALRAMRLTPWAAGGALMMASPPGPLVHQVFMNHPSGGPAAPPVAEVRRRRYSEEERTTRGRRAGGSESSSTEED